MSKKLCMGTVLQQDIASVYTAVAQVTSIKFSGVGGKGLNVQSLDSATDGNGIAWMDKIWNGIADPGELSFDFYLDPALTGHQSLLASNFASTQWKVVYANSGGAYDGFTSVASTFDRNVEVGEALKGSGKLELSGPVTQY